VDSFTGKPDQIVGDEYDFAARELHNGQGLWISPDPTGGTGNKYAYADNNPLSTVDVYELYSVAVDSMGGEGVDISAEGESMDLLVESHAPAATQIAAGGVIPALRIPWWQGVLNKLFGGAPTGGPPDGQFAWDEFVGRAAQNQANDNTKEGNTTVGALAKTMTNEVGSLSTPKEGDPDVLVDAKDALANALINNANLDSPAKVAPATGTASTQDEQIMRNAATNRANGGADPVEGRTQFGTTHNPHIQSRSAMYHLKGPRAVRRYTKSSVPSETASVGD